MIVPKNATPEIQQAIRDIHGALARLATANPVQSTDLSGRRVTNAGPSRGPNDYVTRAEVQAAVAASPGAAKPVQRGGVPVATETGGGGASTSDSTVDTLTVRQRMRLPRLSDGSNHHIILFVDENGQVTGNEDGEFAFDFNLVAGLLELGYNLRLKWFSESSLGSPGDGILNATNNAGTSFLRFVLGLDDATGVSLTKNAAVLEIRVAGGGALTDVTAARFLPATRQTYTPSNVSTLRTGDFAALSTNDVRSILGTLITDLQAAGVIA